MFLFLLNVFPWLDFYTSFDQGNNKLLHIESRLPIWSSSPFLSEPPKFVNTPPEVVFQEEGNDLRLNCSVSGPSDTMVAWYRQGIQEPIVVSTVLSFYFHFLGVFLNQKFN